MRIVYFGMPGEFSLAPLRALLESGLSVCGVIVPAGRSAGSAPIDRLAPTPSPLPIANPYSEASIVSMAWERGIPTFALGRPDHPDALATLSDLQADVACVACFSRRIPASMLALPRYGFLNLHPSLLPAHRGLEPLFWILRNGETAGVTIHFMDEGLDTGDIALQAPLDLPDGISGAQANRLCASLGGRLMVQAVQALARGKLLRRPQGNAGSHDPSPTANDFTLDTTGPARRAFNFMRGTAEWDQPYRVDAGGERLTLRRAIAFDASAALAQPALYTGDTMQIQFTPGVLLART